MTAREKIGSLLTAVNGMTGAADTNLTDGIRRLGAGYPRGYTDNAVVFIDYDGSIIYSCSAAELMAMTALPPNPSHPGLIAQGWNWTLADAKTYVQTNPELVIGQHYTTSDGSTRIHINIPLSAPTYYVGFGVDGTAVVDWGDGSAPTEISGSDVWRTYFTEPHTYSLTDMLTSFVITITVRSGGRISLRSLAGCNAPALLCVNPNATVYDTNKVAYSSITNIELGNNIYLINAFSLFKMYNLSSISVPSYEIRLSDSQWLYGTNIRGITYPIAGSSSSIGNAQLRNCRALRYVSFSKNSPRGSGEYDFYNCVSLIKATGFVPGSNAIGTNMYYGCECLRTIQVPNSVTTIKSGAFGNCLNLLAVVFIGFTRVPTLENVSAFSGISDECLIVVPTSLLNQWKAATNWKTYSSRFMGV